MSEIDKFWNESKERVENYPNTEMDNHAKAFMQNSLTEMYSYNFHWLGRPIIQYPQDIVAVQELIWTVKPDVIIETGIAHGGSLILSASMLALLDLCENGNVALEPNPKKSRRVIGVDIDIRAHNRKALMEHPLYPRLTLIEGSAINQDIIEKVTGEIKDGERIMVFLDSNHTHEHVLAELEAYAPLVSKGSYCVVFDGIVEDLPKGFIKDRPWDKGNNPKTAVWEYLEKLNQETIKGREGDPLKYIIDKSIEDKLQITVSPDGYLKRIN